MRRFILFFFLNIFVNQFSATAATDIDKGYLKFGPKLGYHGFFWRSYSTGNSWPIGIFVAYVSKRTHHTNIISSLGWETGCFFRSAHVSGPRYDVYPQEPFNCQSRSVSLCVKSINIPIIGKVYMGKKRRFCLLLGFSTSYIIKVKGKDSEGEFWKSSGYAALDTSEKKADSGVYNNAYNVFLSKWEKEMCKYTSVPVENICSNRWSIGFVTGIGYEMDMGLSFHYSILIPELPITIGHIVTIGYDVNKLLLLTTNTKKETCSSKENIKTTF